MKSDYRLVLIALFSFFLFPLFSQNEAWERIQPSPQEHDLNCVRQIPGTSRLVAVGNGSTIMFSDDFGENWDLSINPANLFNHTVFLSVCFSDELNGYAVTNKGKIIKTTNGGKDWQITFQKLNANTSYEVDIYTFNADTLIVSGIDLNFYKTKDGGYSWDTIPAPSGFSPISIDFMNKDSGFAVGHTDSSQILYTDNQGDSWTLQDLPIPEIRGCSDIYFKNDTVGFIAGCDKDGLGYPTLYILKTIDKGINWSQVYTSGIAHEFGGIDFKDDMHGCVQVRSWGYTDSFVYTEDAGENWVRDTDAFWTPYISKSFLYCPEYLLCVGEYGRIAKSYSKDESWKYLSKGNNINNCKMGLFTPGNIGFLIRYGDGGVPNSFLMKSDDIGKTWDNNIQFYNYFEGDITFADSKHGFILESDEWWEHVRLHRTTSSGSSWFHIYDFTDLDHTQYSSFNIAFHDSLVGIATLGNKAYKTYDGGFNWEMILSSGYTNRPINSIQYISEDSIYFLTYEQVNPVFIKTYDGGATFTFDTIKTGNHYAHELHFLNREVGFILRSESTGTTIQKTKDGGESWYEVIIHDTTGANYKTMTFPSDEVGYAVGSGPYSTVIKTTDGGENWYPINIHCTSSLNSVHFFDDWHGFVFSDNGAILETYSGGIVEIEENPFVTNRTDLLVYPNPTNDLVQIVLEKPPAQNLIIEIYNLSGQRMLKYLQPSVLPDNTIQINLSRLPDGIYYCKIVNGNSVSAAKVIKL